MVRNISRSYEASAKWKQQLSKEYDVSTNKNVNIKSNVLERNINRSDEFYQNGKEITIYILERYHHHHRYRQMKIYKNNYS